MGREVGSAHVHSKVGIIVVILDFFDPNVQGAAQ
jgi:hypothetical protein